jgi:hypothetical protein
MPEPVFDSSKKMPEPVLNASKKMPEPVFDSSKKMPEPVLNPSKKMPEPVFDSSKKMPEPVFDSSKKMPEPVLNASKKMPEPVLNASKKMPEPVFDSSKKMPEPVLNASKKMPEPVFDSSKKMPEPVLNASKKMLEPVLNASKKMPEPVFDSSKKMSEPVLNPSKKMPEPVFNASRKVRASAVDPSRRIPEPMVESPRKVSSPSELVVETGPVAITMVKEKKTGGLYPVTTMEQDIRINARGDASTTALLVVTLQATMAPITNRLPVIIPGAKKQRNLTRPGELSKSQHVSLPLRHVIPLGAVAAFILFSLFSFSSLSDTHEKIPIVGDAVQWVHNREKNWDLLIGDLAPAEQVGPTPTPEVRNPGPVTLPSSDYVAVARQAAASAGIPQEYFVRQINEESGFNPYARSWAGAVGIAQFEPSTAAGLGINPYDPVASLYGAANYMARLNKSYNGDYAKALAAYNAGPPAVTRATNSGGANWLAYMPLETQRYVHAIMG